jgi:osmotically-inducible protein OsmY
MAVGARAIHGEITAHIDTGSIDARLDFVRLRLDRELAHAVVSALEGSTIVPAGQIWVGVRDGLVILRGQVDSDYQRTAAVMFARGVTGVRSVIDAISVGALSTGASASALHSS